MIALVANLYTLAGNAKTAHWNITGPMFYGVHKILDEVDSALREEGDKLAERLRFLGERPDITIPALVNLDDMPEVNPDWDFEEQTTAIIDGLHAICGMSEEEHGKYGSCEDSMLDALQERCGKYIYLLTSVIS